MNSDVDFLKSIVADITGKPECFTVDRSVDELGVLLKLTIDQENAGSILGKGGQTAMAIRTLLKALGHKNSAKYSLKIVTKA